MPFPFPDRDWSNVPEGTVPPAGAPVADDLWFEAVEDSLREHDGHMNALYTVHGGLTYYIANSNLPPSLPPARLIWVQEENTVVNRGTPSAPDWQPVFVDPYKLTAADLVTDYVVSGLLPGVPDPASLTLSVPAGAAYVSGRRVSKQNAELHTMIARKSMFVDLSSAGILSNTDNGVLIEDCEDVWNEKTDVDFVQSIIAGQQGNAVRFSIGLGAAAGDSVSEAIPAVDLTPYGKVRMWIRSSIALAAGQLQLLLDDTPAAASPVHTLNIPALAANTWTQVDLSYDNALVGTNAIISVGLRYAVDVGVVDVDLDDIWALKATEPAVPANSMRLFEARADADISQRELVDITSVLGSTLYTIRINGIDVTYTSDPITAQVDTVDIVNTLNSTLYTVTINGVAITYTSDADATEGEIALGLVAAINASTQAPNVTAATSALATDLAATFTVTSDTAGVAFTLTTDANLSSTTTTANSNATEGEIALGLVAAINASTDPNVTPVTASTAALATDVAASLTVVADVPGVGFTISVGTNLTVAQTTPNSTANVTRVIDRRVLSPTVRGGATIDDMLAVSQTEVAISAAAVLDSTAVAKMHVLSGAASYAVVLPPVTGNAGKTIGFRVARGAIALVTLDGNGAETIDGEASRIIWELESAILLCTGSEWTKIAGKSRAMGCTMRNANAANPAQGTLMTTGAVTKVALNQIDEDVGGLGDTTNQRINIKRGGIYRISALNYYNNGQTAARATVIVYRNLTNIISAEESAHATGSHPTPIVVGRRPYSAGDYAELKGYHDSAADRYLYADPTGSASYLTLEETQPW